MQPMIQAIRGMNDILPSEVQHWQTVENIFREVLASYGYQEIRFPLVEKTELFQRSIGEATDVVEKEMYTFTDRNNESLTLRPEGTACCVRAGIEHGLLYNQVQRLWYMGANFRYERPQKGRYRQFHQCSAEVFGLEGPDIDAEVIAICHRIIKKLNLLPYIKLQINSLGSVTARANYRKELVKYFTAHLAELDEDSHRRLATNPLRILDSKNKSMQHIIANAPKLMDHLDQDSITHFKKLQGYLTSAGIPFTINPCLVRGLDYYTKTVFEWVTEELGAQGAICAGGRYDGLVEQLGGKATPGLGFAFGMERTILLYQQMYKDTVNTGAAADIYFIVDGDIAFEKSLTLANDIRDKVPQVKIITHCGGGNIKNQFKKADKSGALLALILGEEELKTRTVALKHLREDLPQQTVPWLNLPVTIAEKIVYSPLSRAHSSVG